MGTAAALAILVVGAGCHRTDHALDRAPGDRLAAYLDNAPTLEKLDRPSFDKIIVEPFRGLYADYARAAVPAVGPGHAQVRRHFAGDAALSRSQARLRWMLPVMYPAYVASTVDTVFVEVDNSWRSLAGLDEAMLARVRALDAPCANRLELAGPAGSCSDVGWVIADAALRGDKARLDHACSLAATACVPR